MSTVCFFGACFNCHEPNIHYQLTNINDEADYQYYCMKCIPNGTYQINGIYLCCYCIADNETRGVFVKIDDKEYCLSCFLENQSKRRLYVENLNYIDDE